MQAAQAANLCMIATGNRFSVIGKSILPAPVEAVSAARPHSRTARGEAQSASAAWPGNLRAIAWGQAAAAPQGGRHVRLLRANEVCVAIWWQDGA
jgi:hypothetical protein